MKNKNNKKTKDNSEIGIEHKEYNDKNFWKVEVKYPITYK